MNKEEAKRILEIMSYADGGCVFCVRELFIQFAKEFPELSNLAESIFKEKFNEELLDESHKREIL